MKVFLIGYYLVMVLALIFGPELVRNYVYDHHPNSIFQAGVLCGMFIVGVIWLGRVLTLSYQKSK